MRPVVLALTFAFLVSLALASRSSESIPDFRWTMINVNSRDLQGDAHLLESPTGEKFLIDAGYLNQGLGAYFKRRALRKLKGVVITHPHRDHYEGLRELMHNGVHIEAVYFNSIDPAICNRERPWGCLLEDVQLLIRQLQEKGVAVLPMKQGDVVWQTGNARLGVLYAYDGVHTPVGATDVNDTSAILRLDVGSSRVLFAADLNDSLGKYLGKEGQGLEADVIKVPHHGTEGCAPDAFFDRVAAKIALVPSPKGLWESPRSSRIRNYFSKHAIPAYVNGLHGHVQVRFESSGITVTPKIR